MSRFLFLLLLLIHGLIHLLGFVKAFRLSAVDQLTREIPKSLGLFWLLAGLLFWATFFWYYHKKEAWWMMVLAAVALSQILIFVYWQDAKFGSLANLVIILVCIPAIGKYNFNKAVRQEQTELRANIELKPAPVYSKRHIVHLPPPVQKWLIHSGAIDRGPIHYGWLRQSGKMKTKPGGRWMPFEATQVFNFQEPSFVWQKEVKMMPFIYLTGRDKFAEGQGNMLIKLFSLFKVADEGPNRQVDTGTMIRFMSEMCWFPAAALSPYFSWEAIDENSARVGMDYQGTRVSGVFRFSDQGDIRAFSAQRFYGGGEQAKLEEWAIKILGHKSFDGYRIPSQCAVTWKLAEGDFEWLQLEIEELTVNEMPIN